jgi:hypothetical protein
MARVTNGTNQEIEALHSPEGGILPCDSDASNDSYLKRYQGDPRAASKFATSAPRSGCDTALHFTLYTLHFTLLKTSSSSTADHISLLLSFGCVDDMSRLM